MGGKIDGALCNFILKVQSHLCDKSDIPLYFPIHMEEIQSILRAINGWNEILLI